MSTEQYGKILGGLNEMVAKRRDGLLAVATQKTAGKPKSKTMEKDLFAGRKEDFFVRGDEEIACGRFEPGRHGFGASNLPQSKSKESSSEDILTDRFVSSLPMKCTLALFSTARSMAPDIRPPLVTIPSMESFSQARFTASEHCCFGWHPYRRDYFAVVPMVK